MKRSLGLGILGILVFGCLVGFTETAPPQAKPLKIRLGVHASIMGAPDIIAIRQGYFKQAGLDVEHRKFFLGKEGRDAMIAGAIDINATAPTPFLIGLDKGVPYTSVAVNSIVIIQRFKAGRNGDGSKLKAIVEKSTNHAVQIK